MARPKIKRPPKINFEINLKDYLTLIRVAFLHPNYFISQIPKSLGLIKPLSFFIINAGIGYILGSIWQQIADVNHPSLFFALSQLVILIPLLTLSLFLVCGVLFAIAKLFKGKGNFSQSFSILTFSSLPVIFLSIPIIGLIAFLWLLILNIKGFKLINQYSTLSAIVNIILPLLLIILVGVILGIIGLFLSNLPLNILLHQPSVDLNSPVIQN